MLLVFVGRPHGRGVQDPLDLGREGGREGGREREREGRGRERGRKCGG